MKRERKPLTDAQDAKISSLVQARLPLLETALREGGVLNNNNRGGQQNAQNQQNQQQQQRQQMANNIVNQMFQAMNIPNQNNQGGRGGNNNFNFEQVLGVACAPEATQEQKDQAIQQLSQNFNNRGGGTPNLEQLCQNFGRGGNRGNQNNNLNFNTIRAEVEKKNEVILDKVVASLKPEQGSIIKKLKYEQIKAKGGAERIRGILEEEGTPLSADQIPKIQALFNESNQALRTQAQAMVLKAMETNPPPQQQPNTNQNRGNNNQQQQQSPQQQYMANLANQLLPQVAKLRQQLDNATMNSVMRILTPAQVASYKINLTMPPL